MQVTTIGLDLAKNVFQVHGTTKDDEVAFNRPLRRAQLLSFFSKLEPCLIGMEACAVRHLQDASGDGRQESFDVFQVALVISHPN
jgi:transposase